LLINIIVIVLCRDVRSNEERVDDHHKRNVNNCTRKLLNVSSFNTWQWLSGFLAIFKRLGTIHSEWAECDEVTLHMMMSVVTLEDRLAQ